MSSPTSVELLRRLVGFDTTSRNSNLELIGWIADYLHGLGISSEIVAGEDSAKANLFATVGPADTPGIILSGHTDVVPVDGQDWHSDPFALSESDGRVYGRGTCDMKGFIAAVLAAAPEMTRRRLKTPIHFAFSYDEEVGCIGVRDLLKVLKARPVRPIGCIVGEPTAMKAVRAHKGKASYTCAVRGYECHSSLAHTGVNAVEYGAAIIAFLQNMARERRDQGPYEDGYEPPYTTIHTGVVHGGTALNIVPLDCRFEFEWRYLPGDDPDKLFRRVEAFALETLLPEMQAVHSGAAIVFAETSGIAGFDTPEDAAITTLVKSLANVNDAGKVSFGTEAGLFNEIDIPTIICGPGHIDQAHKPDEFVSLDQLRQCEAFLGRLIERMSA